MKGERPLNFRGIRRARKQTEKIRADKARANCGGCGRAMKEGPSPCKRCEEAVERKEKRPEAVKNRETQQHIDNQAELLKARGFEVFKSKSGKLHVSNPTGKPKTMTTEPKAPHPDDDEFWNF